MKPYYEEAGITIYRGDCREILPQLSAIDAIVSDPPYGISHVKGAGGKGKHDRRNFAPIYGDSEPFDPRHLLGFKDVILWGADHYAERLPHGRFLAWDKLDGLASYDSFSDVEFAWWNQRGASRIYRHLWKGICQASEKDEQRVHPTQKPAALMCWCLNLIPHARLICDPYMGSGTTLLAAKRACINAIGIEFEECYCEVAANRLRQSVLNFEEAIA